MISPTMLKKRDNQSVGVGAEKFLDDATAHLLNTDN